jgi:hypothetical protein
MYGYVGIMSLINFVLYCCLGDDENSASQRDAKNDDNDVHM